MPKKVREALERGTIIDIGKEGTCQYDYAHDILYIAKGASKTAVIHEIGHMVENKLLNSEKVMALKQRLLKVVPPNDIIQDIYYAGDDPIGVFILKHPKFVSDYQGRLYVDDWSEIYDEEWNIKLELLQEFMAEPFREFIENSERLKKEFPEFYKLIEEAVE